MNLRRSKVSAEFNMSSLTDIIFLLLIFFMLTSTIVAPNALKVVLPKADGQTVDPKPVTVSLTAAAEFFVDKQPVNVENLERVVLDRVKVLGEGANVVLAADKDATHENVVKVLEIANRNKLPLVISTNPK